MPTLVPMVGDPEAPPPTTLQPMQGDPNAPLQQNQWLGFQQAIGDLAANVDRYGEAGLRAVGIDPASVGITRTAQQVQAENQARQQQARVQRGEQPGDVGQFAGQVAPWLVAPEMSLAPRLAVNASLGALQSDAKTPQGVAQDAATAAGLGEGGRVAGKVLGNVAGNVVAPALSDLQAMAIRNGWTPTFGQAWGGAPGVFEKIGQKLPWVRNALDQSAASWEDALRGQPPPTGPAPPKAWTGQPRAVPPSSGGGGHGPLAALGGGTLGTYLALKELMEPVEHLAQHFPGGQPGLMATGAGVVGSTALPYTKVGRQVVQGWANPDVWNIGGVRTGLANMLRQYAPGLGAAVGGGVATPQVRQATRPGT